ncbi:amidohydrolase [Treponema sp. OMZ 788]|uniref:M20 metallopeptidase family protein n=1 Tax=unclassified Treponema TaxID=2638727 RepID=UPI0020A41ED1|nr:MULTISPECIES: M20 family metallopeptidase [unclassified Treponema]UTC62705.1 amidohydrolase [Treponema sp. OMZ 787]UTC64412.1 amidohydrolase [Treponema sp. OMZ 788]
MDKYNIVSLVKQKEAKIIQIRRDLHQIPELQLSLPKTVSYVCKQLDELQIPYHKLVDGNAIVATIEGKEKGKCIAIRADMDALPIKENTGLSFASKHEGCMHACGHDGHTAMALGACMVLKDLSSEFKGCVKILFQPGEEYPGGALPMIEEGCLENPKVDALIGLHAGYIYPGVEKGKIGICPGAFFASMDRFQITVRGKGAHGAYPHMSVDPIPIACEIVSALQKIISRELAPTSNALISVCQIHSGTTQNIIPDEVFMEGTVRATDEDVRKFMAKRIDEIASGIAKSYRAEAETVYDFKYPVLMNDKDFTEFFAENTKEILGEDCIHEISIPTMGGEDVAFFLQKVPGTFFVLSNPIIHDGGKIYPHHSDKFDIDESLFYKGTSAVLATVLKYLDLGGLK